MCLCMEQILPVVGSAANHEQSTNSVKGLAWVILECTEVHWNFSKALEFSVISWSFLEFAKLDSSRLTHIHSINTDGDYDGSELETSYT